VTSDYYAILGVAPAAEDVVIGAAYRALMRHYHPDTNPDPDAQAKARAITAAYAVLRDPSRRAEYDASRKADANLWSDDERGEPVDPPRTPAMRGVGIAAALLALALVIAVWAWPRADRPAPRTGVSQPAPEPARSTSVRSEPVVDLQPEGERLARLREEAEVLAPSRAPRPVEAVPPDPLLIAPVETPVRAPAAPPRRTSTMTQAPAPMRYPATKPKIASIASMPRSERVTTLSAMASSFFTQSMANATGAKKDLLLRARNRSAAKRRGCASETCLADAYVRQIRETSAIMEGRTGPPK